MLLVTSADDRSNCINCEIYYILFKKKKKNSSVRPGAFINVIKMANCGHVVFITYNSY